MVIPKFAIQDDPNDVKDSLLAAAFLVVIEEVWWEMTLSPPNIQRNLRTIVRTGKTDASKRCYCYWRGHIKRLYGAMDDTEH